MQAGFWILSWCCCLGRQWIDPRDITDSKEQTQSEEKPNYQTKGSCKQAASFHVWKCRVLIRTSQKRYTLKSGTVHKQHLTIANIYALNIGALNFIKQKKRYKRIHASWHNIVGDFNQSLSYLYRSSKLKISKETSELKYSIDRSRQQCPLITHTCTLTLPTGAPPPFLLLLQTSLIFPTFWMELTSTDFCVNKRNSAGF